MDDDSSSWPEDEACGGFLSAASDRHGLDPPKSPSPLPRDPLADRFPDEPSEESKSLISFLDLDLAEATISDPRRPRLVPPRRRGDNSPLLELNGEERVEMPRDCLLAGDTVLESWYGSWSSSLNPDDSSLVQDFVGGGGTLSPVSSRAANSRFFSASSSSSSLSP